MTTQVYTGAANAWVQVLTTGGLIENPTVFDCFVHQGSETPATAAGFDARSVHIVTATRPLYLPKDVAIWAMSEHADGLLVVTS